MKINRDRLRLLKEHLNVAVLYQNEPIPIINGITKPMKANGYIDGAADIAYVLKTNGFNVCTPALNPIETIDNHWAFPDSIVGIQQALNVGANFIWPNTVLHACHTLSQFKGTNVHHLGKFNNIIKELDDKALAHQIINDINPYQFSYFVIGDYGGLINPSLLVKQVDKTMIKNKLRQLNMTFPLIVKPIRGHSSEGVQAVHNISELLYAVITLLKDHYIIKGEKVKKYGDAVLVEEYLPGEEITITILPPGLYNINQQLSCYKNHWALAPLRRSGHENSILPAFSKLPHKQIITLAASDAETTRIIKTCIQLASKFNAYGPLRFDCRKKASGEYLIFDLNVKPALTSAQRTGDITKEGVISIAAKYSNLSFGDLISGVLYGQYLTTLISGC